MIHVDMNSIHNHSLVVFFGQSTVLSGKDDHFGTRLLLWNKETKHLEHVYVESRFFSRQHNIVFSCFVVLMVIIYRIESSLAHCYVHYILTLYIEYDHDVEKHRLIREVDGKV